MDLATLLALLSDPNSAAASSSHRDYQSPSHTAPANATHHRHAKSAADSRAFTPKFDILETAQAYILEGELPGLVDKRAVEIEFTGAQTLLVKGRIEKKVEEAVTEPALAPVEEPKPITQDEHEEEKVEENPVEEKHAETTPARPRTPPKPAYVEDSPDEDDDYEDARRSTAILTPTSTIASSPKQEKPKKKAPVVKKPSPQQVQKTAQEQPKKQEERPQQPQIRYWVSERTIGSFQRTFSFPGLIDQDGVTAKLENGILTVVVPKRQKMAARRIEVL